MFSLLFGWKAGLCVNVRGYVCVCVCGGGGGLGVCLGVCVCFCEGAKRLSGTDVI